MDDFSAVASGAWAEANLPLGVLQQSWVVVDDDDGVAGLQEELEAFHKAIDVGGVQSAGGFVEDEEGAAGAGQAGGGAAGDGIKVTGDTCEDGGDSESLGFTPGNGTQRLPQRQIGESSLFHGIQPMLDSVLSMEESKRVIAGHLQNFMHATVAVANFEDFGEESVATTGAAGGVDIGQKLHRHGDLSAAFASRAAASFGRVETEHGSRVVATTRFVGFSQQSPDIRPDTKPRGRDASEAAFERLLIQQEDSFEVFMSGERFQLAGCVAAGSRRFG